MYKILLTIMVLLIIFVIICITIKITINMMYYRHPLGLFSGESIICDCNYEPRDEKSLYRYEGNNKISYSPSYWNKKGGIFKKVNCTGLKLIN